jgi:hypothetical protein
LNELIAKVLLGVGAVLRDAVTNVLDYGKEYPTMSSGIYSTNLFVKSK